MDIKDIKTKWLIKITVIITITYLVVNHTRLWGIVNASISPILYAFVIAYTLDYIVRFFEKRLKLPRAFSIFFTMVLFIALLLLIGIIIVPRIIDAVSSLIKAVSNIRIDFDALSQINFDNIYLNEIQQSIIDALKPFLQRITNATGNAVMIIVNEVQRVTSGVISFIVALIIAIYMLAEKKDLMARIKRGIYAYFSDEQANRIYYISNLANTIFKDFFVGKLIDSLIIGVLAFAIFTTFGYEFGLLMAVIIGITNMIPYFGPFIGAVPVGIITFVASPSTPINVFWVLVIILIIQQLDGWVIGPFILSDSVGVSAFWIVIAVTIGGATFGLVGMFLGVPVCVLLKTLIEEDIVKRLYSKGIENFQSTDLKRIKQK